MNYRQGTVKRKAVVPFLLERVMALTKEQVKEFKETFLNGFQVVRMMELLGLF